MKALLPSAKSNNLTRARFRNPAVENQAVDRIVCVCSQFPPCGDAGFINLFCAAPPRSNKARHDSQVDHRKLDRGSPSRGTKKEDRASQHDPRTKLQQAGLDAPSHGRAQTALQSLIMYACPLLIPQLGHLHHTVYAVRCRADTVLVFVCFTRHIVNN